MSDKQVTPTINSMKNGPYLVKGIDKLVLHDNKDIPIIGQAALCRCGKSKSKPFCDGSHSSAGYRSDGKTNESRHRDYAAGDITIHDNRRLCSHEGSCTRNLPQVFDKNCTPWINPNGASSKEIIKVVSMCPSGALSYSYKGQKQKGSRRDPRLKVVKNGPYKCHGYINFTNEDGKGPHNKEHFVLCRCGESKNKPYCDGTHYDIGFNDEE